jgi:crotonobetainyl-CoA:carnitine CoA-transferase CaiB-like acyl-CoA transferase
VPASRVLTLEEHFDDPQVAHNRLYGEMDEPHLGRIRRARHPALFNGEPIERDDRAVPELHKQLQSHDEHKIRRESI